MTPAVDSTFLPPPIQNPLSRAVRHTPGVSFQGGPHKFSGPCQPACSIHENCLNRRIIFQARIRLGLVKAISVLQKEIDGSPTYPQVTRPCRMEQPATLPSLTQLFDETLRANALMVGLEKACLLLENASVDDPQESCDEEKRLNARINYQVNIRLGLAKTISVLKKEIDGSPTYPQVTRPCQMDQPATHPPLTHFIRISEIKLFTETVRTNIVMLGFKKACELLENAKEDEIPNVLYVNEGTWLPPYDTPEYLISTPRQQVGIWRRLFKAIFRTKCGQSSRDVPQIQYPTQRISTKVSL